MGKLLVGVALGVFVGAMVAEVIKKTNPEWLQKLKGKIGQKAREARQAFAAGYEGTKTA